MIPATLVSGVEARFFLKERYCQVGNKLIVRQRIP
jgi:hypothetical protein